MSALTVSGPTQAIRAGHTSAATVSRTVARATSIPRTIWATGPPSTGAGSARVTGAPARAVATVPSELGATTTIGIAPPDHATSASRRTRGWPSASASADSTEAARMTAATGPGGWYLRGTS